MGAADLRARKPAASSSASVSSVVAEDDAPPVIDYQPGDYRHGSPYAAHPWTWPVRLFVASKFAVHRVLGLAYLIQYAAAWALYIRDWRAFAASPLLWTLPASGVAQSLTAAFYFRFLPKQRKDPGYYADRGTISYDFVLENIFYASILMWQYVYMNERAYGPAALAAAPPALRAAAAVAEALWTFLPYMVFRPLVPKTRFRDGLSNDGNKTAGNAAFLYVGTVVTKAFYLWAKWFLGFFFNYLRFLGLLSEADRRELYRMLLFSAFATTIAVFLHTLKFKNYIGPKTSFGVYMISYLLTFWSMVELRGLFVRHGAVVAVTAVAALLNRFGHHLMGDRLRDVPGFAWQIATMALFYAVRYDTIQLPAALALKQL